MDIIGHSSLWTVLAIFSFFVVGIFGAILGFAGSIISGSKKKKLAAQQAKFDKERMAQEAAFQKQIAAQKAQVLLQQKKTQQTMMIMGGGVGVLMIAMFMFGRK